MMISFVFGLIESSSKHPSLYSTCSRSGLEIPDRTAYALKMKKKRRSEKNTTWSPTTVLATFRATGEWDTIPNTGYSLTGWVYHSTYAQISSSSMIFLWNLDPRKKKPCNSYWYLYLEKKEICKISQKRIIFRDFQVSTIFLD